MTLLKYLPRPLLDDIVLDRCVPVVGAGFSKNAELPKGTRMPDWRELGEEFEDHLPPDLLIPGASPVDTLSAYAHAYTHTKLAESLRDRLHIDLAKPGRAHLAFASLPFDVIVTTNFDFLLERSLEARGKVVRVVVQEEQLAIGGPRGMTTLLKLHGDLAHPRQLVVTEADYDTYLQDHQLFATYLANLLISRTPLFIGYSLDDPDFRQILQIIASRLGRLRRPAYALSVNAGAAHIAKFQRRGVAVVSLPAKKSGYGDVLTELFEELDADWKARFRAASTVTSEDARADFALPEGVQSRLCYFDVPKEIESLYRQYVFPIAAASGLSPTTPSDIIAPGDNIVASITALIERAAAVVIDADESSGLFLPPNLDSKDVLLITAKGTGAKDAKWHVKPPARLTTLERPPPESFASEFFIEEVADFLAKAGRRVQEGLRGEPHRLLEKGEFRASVIAALTLVEARMREIFLAGSPDRDLLGPYQYSARALLEILTRRGLVNEDDRKAAINWIALRNRLVHGDENVTRKQATEAVQGLLSLLERIEQANNRAKKGR